jgi:hypothetical protein
VHKNEVFTSQPQVPIWVNWGHPLSRGLEGAWNGVTPHLELISRRLWFANSNGNLMSQHVSREGRVMSTSVSSPNISYTFKNEAPINTASPFTIICRFRIKSFADRAVFGFNNISGEGASIDILTTGRVRGSTIRANTIVESDAIYTAGDWVTVAYTAGEGAFNLWVNGVKQNNANTGSLSSFQARDNTSVCPSDTELLFGYNYSRVLADLEIRELTRNPWQILTKTSYPLFAPTGDSGVLIPDLTSPGVIDIAANSAKPELNVQY